MKKFKALGFEILSRNQLRSVSGGICKTGVKCDPSDPQEGCAGECKYHSGSISWWTGERVCDGYRCTPKIPTNGLSDVA